tara:strand:+ start:43 stop:291 length:249 start_codon:yes stop_codon:yes gene_type:complete
MNNEQLIRLQQDINCLLARADMYRREPSGVTDNNYLVDRWVNNLTQQDIQDEYCSYFKSVKKPAKRKVKKVYNFETFCNKMY